MRWKLTVFERRKLWLHPSTAWGGAILWMVMTSSALAEPVNLDGFLDKIEIGCNLPTSLEMFRSELNARYSYEDGVQRLVKHVRLPASIKNAIGPAMAVRHADHTSIRVPLVGIYRGLPTRSISFDIGHSNGIGVTTLTFAAPAQDVERIIGADVARTMQDFSTDPVVQHLGLSARIRPEGHESSLVCDTST